MVIRSSLFLLILATSCLPVVAAETIGYRGDGNCVASCCGAAAAQLLSDDGKLKIVAVGLSPTGPVRRIALIGATAAGRPVKRDDLPAELRDVQVLEVLPSAPGAVPITPSTGRSGTYGGISQP